MDEPNATPGPTRRNRPKKFPASLSIMLTEHQRANIDAAATEREDGAVAPVAREWLALGRDLEEALRHPEHSDLGERVEALRREDGTSSADALACLLDLGEREVARRRDRNVAVATRLAESMDADGVPFDDVDYGTASVDLRG